ncbi:MAG TPA: DUF1700 domain-containing protein [Bacilli bacterium]|nr:DUF1700 domain-containing protein [Bacilli bacterium]
MNKKEFLSKLERKLSILDEQEIKDIINEYEDIIEEKVKDGKTEEEAVKEFGSIDELSEEILKAYKLNSKYAKDKDQVKDTIENFEDGIKKVSHSLADFFKNINNGNGISVELIFELIIKFLILLVLLTILRLPFELLINLGRGIFDITFHPISDILNVFWYVAMICLYFMASALIFIALFKEYVSKNNNNKISAKSSKKNEKEEVTKEEKVKEQVNDIYGTKKSSGSTFNSIINGMYKLFMTLIFLIPLWFIDFGLAVALAVVIYYTIVGINIWGLIIVLGGLLLGFSWLTTFFHSITFSARKVSIIPMFISILLVVVGGLAFASNVMTFDYIDETKVFDLKYKTYKEEFNVENIRKVDIPMYKYLADYEVDNTIEDNRMIIEIKYPYELFKIENIELENDYRDYYDLTITDFDINSYKTFKYTYNTIISDLKKGKVYKYSERSFYGIKIIANEKTMEIVK